MARNDNVSDFIGVGFQLDTNNLRKGLREASNAIKGFQAETKAANAGMSDWKGNVDGLSNKIEELTKVERIQEQAVKALSKEYEEIAHQYGEQSERAIRAQRALLKWETGLKTTQAQTSSYIKELDRLKHQYEANTKYQAAMVKGLGVMRGVMINLATDAIRMVARGLKQGVEAAISYEAAFKDVQKTVNGTVTELAMLNADLRTMSVQTLPKSVDELAQIAAIGGQLGIPVKNLSDFTRIMTQLGDSTNVTAEQAALLISKIGAQTGLDPSQFDRFASALVALGNNFATTEDRILDMTNRIASSGAIVGASEQQMLALATALSATGAEAEAGGTALTRLFKRFQLAVETQNEDLPKLARIAGLTSEEFRKLFGEDAIEALLAFTRGLGDMDREGTSVAKNLADLGITEVRLTETIQKLVLNQEGVERALKLSASAWEENNALSKEAETRYDSTAAKVQLLKNNMVNLGIAIVDNFGVGGFLEGSITMLGNFAQKIAETLDPLQKVNRLLNEINTDVYGDTSSGAVLGMFDAIEAYKTAADEIENINDKLDDLKFRRKYLADDLERYKNSPELFKQTSEAIGEIDKELALLEGKYGAYLYKMDAIGEALAKNVELDETQLAILEQENAALYEAYIIHRDIRKETEETNKAAGGEGAKFSADPVIEKYKSQQTKALENIKKLEEEQKKYKELQEAATDPKEVAEYGKAIKAVTEEIDRQTEAYEKLYGAKAAEEEKSFSAESYILKYGSEEEKSLVRQKKLKEEIAKLEKEQLQYIKGEHEEYNEYATAIKVLNDELRREQGGVGISPLFPLDVEGFAARHGDRKPDKPLTKEDAERTVGRYGNESQRIGKQVKDLQNLEKAYRDAAEEQSDLFDRSKFIEAADALKKTYTELENSLKPLEKSRLDKYLDSFNEYQRKYKETVDFIGSQIKDMIDSQFAYQEEAAQAELDNFRDSRKEEEDALEDKLAQGEISYAEYYAEQRKLKEENDNKEAELEKKLQQKKKAIWVANKVNNISEALINGYVAATKALAELGPVGGPIAATAIGLLAATQVGLIASQQYQPPALAKGGIVDKPTYALVGEAGKEAVMPLENNTGWIDELAGKLVIRMEGGNVTDSHNRDYQITQNIYAKPATRRELYLATRRAMEI